MSTTLVEQEVAKFLKSTDSEVLCIKGKWGVGKTFAWNAFLRSAAANNTIALTSYSYVSLFGLNSLDQLKYAIFENSVSARDAGIEPSVETLQTNTLAVGRRMGMKSLSILQSLPPAKNYASALQSLAYLSVRDRIVCIDDLERKSAQLAMKDILGLLSQLKEQKGCKVVLILNDDVLEGNDKSDFLRLNEKVIDVSLVFEPSAADCARIALLGTGLEHDYLRQAVIALGISNIRIVKKAERFVTRVSKLVSDLDPKVLHQAVQSITVFAWSLYARDEAPTIEFLKETRGEDFFGLRDTKTLTDDEKKWNALLNEFGFVGLDDFDALLLQGILRGFFDEEKVRKQAEILHKRLEAMHSEESVRTAWRLYHGSFDNDEDEVVRELCASFRREVRFMSPASLNGTVTFLKGVQRLDEARQILEYFMTQRSGDRNFYDLSTHAFAMEISDPDVRKAFSDRYESFGDKRSPTEILQHVAEHSGWSPEDVGVLGRLSPDDFYALFKESRGDQLTAMVRASLSFAQIIGVDEALKKVSANAREALVRIGRESLINRLRVRKFGVEIDN